MMCQADLEKLVGQGDALVVDAAGLAQDALPQSPTGYIQKLGFCRLPAGAIYWYAHIYRKECVSIYISLLDALIDMPRGDGK